jgi:glutamate racemase
MIDDPIASGVTDNRPIGVFDSGVGGLTVLSALMRRLPQESFVYLGDTARLPYGTKSADSVARYACQCADRLIAREVKALVIACNTAASAALDVLQTRYASVPVIGVIEPGALAARAATRTRRVAVLATEGTIRANAYGRALAALAPDVRVTSIAAPVFVALAEEGWIDGPIVELIAKRYLTPVFDMASPPDTVLLGCTHFPVLASTLASVMPPSVTMVDSAATTAEAVARLFDQGTLAPAAVTTPSVVWLATDGPERFARVGSRFLGRPIDPAEVTLIDV